MIFSLDVRPARNGDCLLLHYGTKKKPGLILIDGGPTSVYTPHLKPRLMEIRNARKIPPQQPLPVDLMMVSHVDDDHIRGMLDLTKELAAAEGSQVPIVRIAGCWHNSFDELIGKDPKELTASVVAQFGTASTSGGLPVGATVKSKKHPEVVHDTLKVLASIEQGHRLRGDMKKLAIALNPHFDGKLILAAKKRVSIAPDLAFTVAGPMKPELKKLQDDHDKWLVAQEKKKKKDPEAALAAYVDDSVPNLSSIVVVAESKGKRMLLTGDARGDKILLGLEAAGVVKKGGSIHVDIMKVPHHGSDNNVEPDFFERITADHYVMSGNGEHGNPERATIEMLFTARGKDPFELHLTYPLADIDKERKKDAAQHGKTFSPAKNGLVALFAKHKLAKGQKLTISNGNAAHVVDLLDPLGL